MSMESPLNELLATKLFEHDKEPTYAGIGDIKRVSQIGWSMIDEDERQTYRDMASGKTGLYEE